MSDVELEEPPPGDRRNGSKLDKVLNKINMDVNSREGSPDPSKKKSRRKPTVTRKVEADDEQDIEAIDTECVDEVMPQVPDEEMEVVEDIEAKSPPLVNGNNQKTGQDENEDKTKESEDFVIPEGTVIVEPEPVEESKLKEFKGPEWKSTKRLSRSVALGIIQCTACNKQINTNHPGAARRHPALKVLICKRCYSWYADSEIEQDSDGMDEQCRWCGDGGNLICCDFCHNAFCKGCIKKNLGRKELSDIIDAGEDDKWHCYVCDPKPLANLISDCTATLEDVETENKKKEQPKKPVATMPKPKSTGSQKDSSTPKSSKTTQVAKKSTTQGVKTTSKTPTGPTIVSGPQGPIMLPPGAIPVKTVLNSSGNQVIVLQQPLATKTVQTDKAKQHKTSFLAASEEQLRIIGQAVKNVSQSKSKAIAAQGKKPVQVSQQKPLGRTPMVRYEWEAPINEYNVAQTLDRTLAVTESLRMVMVSLKDDMKKANQLPVTQCLEKKRVVSAKLKRAMGAFKKQVQDIELFCKSTFKTIKVSSQQQLGKQPNKSQPFPVSMIKNKPGSNSGSKQTTPKSKKDVEVIELSSSDDEAQDKSQKKRRPSEETKKAEVEQSEDLKPSKEKKGFSLKLKLGGDGSSLGGNRKRKFSENEKTGSGNEDNDSEKVESEEPKDKKPKEDGIGSSDDEPLSSRIKNKDPSHSIESKKVESECASNDQETDDLPDNKNDASKKDDDESKAEARNSEKEDGKKSPKTKGMPDEESESDSEVKDKGISESKKENKLVLEKSEKKQTDKQESDSDVKEKNDHNVAKVNEDETENIEDFLLGKREDEEEDEETSGENNIEKKDTEDNNEISETESKVKVDKEEAEESSNFSLKKVDVEKADDSKNKKPMTSNEPDSAKLGEAEDDNEMDTSFGGLKFEPLFVPGEESNEVSKVQEKSTNKKQFEEQVLGTLTETTIRSRSDIEAQRELHKELLEDDSSEDVDEIYENEDLTDDGSECEESSKSNKCNDEEYNPHKKKSGKSRQSSNSKIKENKDTVADGSRKNSCLYCRKVFKTEKLLSNHVNQDHPPVHPYQCAMCSKTYSYRSHCVGHIKSSHKIVVDNYDAFIVESADKMDNVKKLHAEIDKKTIDKEKSDETDDEQCDKSANKKSRKASHKDKNNISNSNSKLRKKVENKSKDNSDSDSDCDTINKSSHLESSKSKRTSKSKGERLKKAKTNGVDSQSDLDTKKDESKSRQSKKHNNKDSQSDLDTKKEKSKSKQSKKHNKKDPDSDGERSNSSNYDSELEKDIEKLAKAPKVNKPRQKKGQKQSEEESDIKKEKKSKTEKTGRSKPKHRRDLIAELSNSSGGEGNGDDDVDEAMEEERQDGSVSDEMNIQDAGDQAMAALEAGLGYDDLEDEDQAMDNQEADEEENKDDQARKALLADGSSASDSADSDVDAILAKKLGKGNNSKKSSKNSSAKSSAVQSEDENNDKVSTCDSQESDKRKSKRKSNRLLDAKLSDDSEDDFDIPSKNKKKASKAKGSDYEDEEDDDASTGGNLSDVSSDFDIKPKKKVVKKKKKSSSSEPGSDDESDTGKKGKKGQKGNKRKRIKVASDSSRSDGENESGEDNDGKGNKKKKIRKLIKDNKLSQDTKSAARAEEDRRQRIVERQKLYNQVDEDDLNSPTKAKITTKLVLEMDEDKEPIVEVHAKLIRKLKAHQVEAVRFLWDCCIESVDRAKEEGAGCILAHCMGLGKTLSVITFVHTLMSHPDHTGIEKALVVCPLNTVLNWQHEFSKWLDKKDRLDVYELASVKDSMARARLLEDWFRDGGIMIIGYEMYRNLSTLRNIRKAKQKKIFTKCLVDPGPDIAICDEGHILKNDASALSKAMNNIKTRRRVCLTGTPLQNNLVEYHCMVDFVKPKLLGTRKEFVNRFVNPIKNGQCSDSTSHDVKLMKKRAHILHETLAGCVQRKDYSALTKFLPPKHEYVISVRLSEVQIELYQKYLSRVGHGPLEGEKLHSAQLFSDYQALMRIWTHPWVLKLQEIREENKKLMRDSDDSLLDEEDSMDSFIDDSDSTDSSENESESPQSDDDSEDSSKKNTRASRHKKGKTESNGKQKRKEVVKKWKTSTRGGEGSSRPMTPQEEQNGESSVSSEWWAQHLSEEDRYNLEISGKIMLLAEVLRMSEAIGDKVLVFSQSLLSLDLIEDFLAHWDSSPVDEDSEQAPAAGTMGWTKGLDYFRMDGSTSAQYRKSHADTFNEADNVRSRLFLISTRAGSLGTNLVGANRVIIFDASWNPSHDTQSIFRVYRFGQTKPVYIYRFLAQGTMEEKIYERQVTKQSLSQRVVDEHQIERHFSTSDLRELYNFTPERVGDKPEDEYIHILPKDRMLADLLTDQKMWIVKYHEHDSLLENKVSEDLTEEERKSAWEEYELEKKQGYRVRQPTQMNSQFFQHYNIQQPNYGMGASNVPYPAAHQQVATPPQFNVQQIEQLARAIYAANPGIEQSELQKRVQVYIQHQQIQFYQRQREQMRQQSLAYMQQYQTQNDQEQTGAASLLRNMATQGSSAQSSRSNSPLPGTQPSRASSSSSLQSFVNSSASTLQSLLKK